MSELYHDSESCLILIPFRGVTESKMDKNIWVNFAHASSTWVTTGIIVDDTLVGVIVQKDRLWEMWGMGYILI